MIKVIGMLLLMTGSAMAQNQGPQRGMAQDKEAKERKLQLCMVDLTDIKDPELRKWCEIQSKRLP